MKRSVRFRRTESSQLQAIGHIDDHVELPFSTSRTPFFSERENSITSLVECEVIADVESKSIVTVSGPGERANTKPEIYACMPAQEVHSEFLEQSGRPDGASGSDNSAAYTSASKSISKKAHATTRFGFRYKPNKTLHGFVARRQLSEPLPNQRLAVIRELNAEKSGTWSSSWTSHSSISMEAEEVGRSTGDTRLSWSSPVLISVGDDASHSLQLDDAVLLSLVNVLPNATCRQASSNTLETGGSKEASHAVESERSTINESPGAAAECSKHAPPEPCREVKAAPSPLPRTLKSVLSPATVKGDHSSSSSAERVATSQANRVVSRRELNVLSKVETAASAEATPAFILSLRSREDNRRQDSACEVHIANGTSSDTLQAQPMFTFAPAVASTSMAFVVSTIAGSSSSRDSPLSSRIRRASDVRSVDDAVSPSPAVTSVSPRSKAVRPLRTFANRHSMSSESLSLSLRAKAKRWQWLPTLVNSTASTVDPLGARYRRECFSVEMLSSSSTLRSPLHEQPESSMSFSVLESPVPILPSTTGESTALLDEDCKYDCSTLRSSVRDRAIEACASLPFSRAQLASLDTERRTSSSEESGQKRITRPRFGNPDCS
ncbi:hypothetical protein MTO96_023979 [Rhipicephalus appendiculatus]